MLLQSLVTRGGWTPWFVQGVQAVVPHRSEFLGRCSTRFCPVHPKIEKWKAVGLKVDCRLQEQHTTSSTSKRILSVINDATKYTVVLICFSSVVVLRSLPVAWSLTGSIVAAYICKVRDADTAKCSIILHDFCLRTCICM